ncbi:hypothetical protein [Actinoplanes sp. CA-252034]|uniref:hypothetical protein n=1 Tax=Actinoplanes sp. CA-252034 TaxID=3239906 RepID=UPI003D9928BD
MRRRVLLGSAAVGAAGLVGWRPGSSLAATTGATSRGGSNYGWYQIDGCNREPYGVVNSFHKAPDLIRSQLAAMRAAGQARLRVHIIHRHRPDTGTAMDSTGGNISASNRQNLTDLLRAIDDAGFVEIQVAFMPIGDNAAYNWSSWNDDMYQENWNLIANLRPIIAGSGIHYRIDLCNEAVPTKSQPVLLAYTQRLWNDYTNAFDKKDTVGFSAIGYAGRIENIPKVYGNNPPYLFDFHFYRRNGVDEGSLFTTAHNMMNQYGYTKQGWTIGEVFNNDPTAASTLRQAIDSTGRTVYYLLQWPRQAPSIDVPDPTCPDATVPPPPVNFGAYIAQGF